MDVSLWKKTVPLIVNELSTILPDHKDEIKKRGFELRRELEQLHKTIRALLSQFPRDALAVGDNT